MQIRDVIKRCLICKTRTRTSLKTRTRRRRRGLMNKSVQRPNEQRRHSEKPLVSVVILAWNRCSDVRESLKHIRKSTYQNLEVIVCDNGSVDNTADMVRAEFPEALLIRFGNNIGIEAYNAGFRAARGEFVVILDDDSWPAADAIAKMVDKFESECKLGIVAFDVRNCLNHEQVALDAGEDSVFADEPYLMGFNGAGAGVRKAVFKDVGYYPGEFFLYWNEQDLSLRALNAGWQVRHFSDVVSFHKRSPVNRASWRAPFFYCRNAFWLVWKNYPLLQAFSMTLRMGRLIIHHSLEQRTTIYFKAMISAMANVGKIAPLRNPVRAEIARKFRAPIELSFTLYR
jgi:GT2 family glycosyltransferase